jgi:uncharacterized protein (DUF1330 family)
MTCKVIGLIHLKDKQAFDEYRSQVGQTVELYGGRVCARGQFQKSFWNELNCQGFDAYVELEFTDTQAAQRWAESAEYQSLVGTRSKAMNLTLFSVAFNN